MAEYLFPIFLFFSTASGPSDSQKPAVKIGLMYSSQIIQSLKKLEFYRVFLMKILESQRFILKSFCLCFLLV